MKNADMPAMPFEEVRNRIEGHPHNWTNHKGMTKREMIAMHMMAHLMPDQSFSMYDEQAKYAVMAADALLAELEKQGAKQ